MTSANTQDRAVAPWFDVRTEQDLVYELFRDQTWTEAAYLAFTEAFNRPIELSGGKLVILPMPTLCHQRTLRRFYGTASAWLERTGLGECLFALHPVRLWPGKYREPDAMVWLGEHRNRMGERESGPPDLALEVVSPSTEPHDTDTKLTEYALAAIPESWIVNPRTHRVSVYTLEGRSYRVLGHFGPGELARSAILPGFEVAVDDLLATE